GSVLPPPRIRERKPSNPSASIHLESLYWPPKVFTAKDGIMRTIFFYQVQGNSTGVLQHVEPVAVFYVTHDSGTTWKSTTPLPVKVGPNSLVETETLPSDFADINNGWIADHGALYSTTNRGHEWTTVPTVGFPVANQLNFVSAQVGWAIRRVVGEMKSVPPSLFKTVDGGRTWTPVTYAISPR
ncbi:MAG TPA: hypothetical protein VNA31_11725, partial [bacterium]|nr:hypothetical protein [bacterium]